MTSPDHATPPGAITTTGGLHRLQNLTADTVRNAIGTTVSDNLKTARDAIGTHVLTPIEDLRAGQEDLAGRVDLLSALEHYGQAYMPTSHKGAGRLDFSAQNGPVSGVTVTGGGLRLDHAGLWQIHAQIWPSWVALASSAVDWHVLVTDPTGTAYDQRWGRLDNPQAHHSALTFRVVTPTPGYHALVQVTSIAKYRELLGGRDRTSLSAWHLSHDTAGAIAGGAGPGDTPADTARFEALTAAGPDTWTEDDWAFMAAMSGTTVEQLKEHHHP